MPLKHATETLLLFLIGAVIAVTGLLVASLPPLPAGGIPWAILLLLAFLYPLALTPLFCKRRADYPFRLLHWVPAVLLLVWFALELLTWAVPALSVVRHIYTWGWTFAGVAVSFALVVWFCLSVIRRREARMMLLGLAFVPFAAGALASELGGLYEQQLAAVLWEGALWKGTGTVITDVGNDPDDKNLAPSSDPNEEAWRDRLRASEGRSSSSASVASDNEDVLTGSIGNGGGTSSAPSIGSASSKPGQLPDAGGELEVLLLTMIAAYSAVLHDRARRRV